jgi:LPXTG-motif cell wall-anchored protein
MLPLIFAFCGFYVSGSGAKLSNDATQVVLMRDSTRTVLSMQNDYRGPLEDFAMVVPVPVVLHEGDVKTLTNEVFEHVEALGSPRLVEYWEQDPCPAPVEYGIGDGMAYGAVSYGAGTGTGYAIGGSVKIEAKFDVAEYQIVILSATDSAGLETWLKDNEYKIPAGAEPLLRPYVEGGMKFFVAKVNPTKVHMDHGHAALSPLRFDYDSEDFALPIRLGMANSAGKQDLIINILSRDKRYEVANYKNVFIPTNFDVKNSVKARFSEFYAALFDKTIEKNPGAVVTEYAWTATRGYHCDPCPTLDVTTADIASLGGDVIGGDIANNFVLTRLHARYGKKDMKDDLVFREATPVTGGREEWSKSGIEYGASPSEKNFFQARYAIRHYWSRPITCAHPQRYVWGGPPDGVDSQTIAASKLAFAPRGKLNLASVISRDLWEIGYKKARKAPATGTKAMGLSLGALVLLGLGAFILRRRRT